MANAYSTPLNYGHAIPTTDVAQYIGTIQTAMQQRFDTNLAKVDEMIQQVVSVPLVRDSDKQYLGERLQNMLTQVDSISKLDLTSNSTTRKLTNYIAGAVDDTVKEQIGNSKKIYKFNSELEAMKAKNPKLYNEANHAYASYKAGLNAYMDGSKDTLGNLEYIPYTDISEEHLKKIKTLKEIKGKRTIQEQHVRADGTHEIIEKSIEGLTDNEIMSYMSSLMTSEELTQLRINGWAKYSSNPKVALEKFDKYKEEKIKLIDADIEYSKSVEESSSYSESEKKLAKARREKSEKQKDEVEQYYSKFDTKNIEALGFELEHDAYINGLAGMAKSEWNISFKKDEAYYAQKQLELDYEKNEREKLETAIKMKKAGLDASGNPTSDGTISISTADRPYDENVDGMDVLKKDHDENYKTILSIAKDTLSGDSVPQADKTAFINELKRQGLDANLNWIKPESAEGSKAAAIKAAYDSANLVNVNPDKAKEMAVAYNKKSSIAADMLGIEKDVYKKVFSENANGYIQDFAGAREAMTLNTPATLLRMTGAPGRFAKKLEDRYSEISNRVDKFVKDNGGYSKMAESLKADPIKLKTFMALRKEMGETFDVLNVFSKFSDLKANAKPIIEATLKDRTRKGSLSSFTTYNEVNIIAEGVVEQIISEIPHTRATELFNKERSVTAFKDRDANIVIQQNLGMDGDNNPKYARVTVDKGDAAYKTISNLIDMEFDKSTLKASTSSAPVAGSKPKFIDEQNGVMLGKAANAILKNNIPLANGGFLLNESSKAFLSKSETEEAFKFYLKGKYPEDKINSFAKEYTSNINKFSLKALPTNDSGWSLEIRKPSGELLSNKPLGVENLSKEMVFLITYYPQVVISESIVRELRMSNDKNLIDKII